MKTVTETEEYYGKPLLKIYEVNDKDEKSEKPIISFGTKKAKAILVSVEEIKKFLEGEK